MVLFENFRDTIFVKNSSEIEKKINALEAIKDKVKDKNAINREIKILIQGLKGENNISYELKNANIGMYVMHDVNIVYEDMTAQIDYIIITPVHCYLVECKNLIGNVTVTKDGEFRREYTIDGITKKEAIYSPYAQAIRHKEILKKHWLNMNNKIFTYFFEKTFDEYYKPLVVLANPAGLLNIRYAPKKIKNVTIRIDNLIEYLKNDMKKYDKKEQDTKKDMEELASKILSLHRFKKENYAEKYELLSGDELTQIDVNTKTENKLIIQENQKNILREKLIKFRTEKSYLMNVPAYYIFKNDELEKLLEYMPKTVDELKRLKILEPIKVKCHGEEIINIINNV